jgi:hypothetical protein
VPVRHPAPGRSPCHPLCLRPGVPLRPGHPTWAGSKLAAACLVQGEFFEGGDPLVFSSGASVLPDQGKHVRCLRYHSLGEWPNEPSCGKFSVDHWRSTKSNPEPIDRRRQCGPKLAEPQQTGRGCSVKTEAWQPRGPAELAVLGLCGVAFDQGVPRQIRGVAQRRRAFEE